MPTIPPLEETASPAPAEYSVGEIYREEYAALYPALYVAPWSRKHRINRENLTRVLDGMAPRRPLWLDIACGQATQFSAFGERTQQVGVDLSRAQLTRARRNAPDALLIHANITQVSFLDASFDLVTNFWAGYCYLDDQEKIVALVRSAVRWIRDGGALYWEVLLARDLAEFNRSRYAANTGFGVTPRTSDYSRWSYDDIGGRHLMTSPPIEVFLREVEGRFRHVEAVHDGGFMVHLIATGRHRETSVVNDAMTEV